MIIDGDSRRIGQARHTSLFLLALSVRTTVHTGLEDFILALKLILELVFEFPHFVGGSVDHWALAGLQGGRLLVSSIRSSLGHCGRGKEPLAGENGGMGGNWRLIRTFFSKFWATAGETLSLSGTSVDPAVPAS